MTEAPERSVHSFPPQDPAFEERVTKSFRMQTVMRTMGIDLVRVAPGMVELTMPFNTAYTQQHGFMHAGVTTTALDSACAYAAFSLMPPDAAVLTVELKTNLIAPAKGRQFRFRGTVVKPGRNVSFCEGRAWAITDEKEALIASMTATIMALHDRPDMKH